MIRAAILLALGTAHGGCSPDEATSEPNVASAKATVTAGRENSARRSSAEKGSPFSQDRVSIKSDRGQVIAHLVDNEATRALVQMLPLTLELRDHLRQEKTGSLPSPLPELHRQSEYSAGTLGLWGNDDLVIYYRNGRVPKPGIIILGHLRGDLSIFDRPGPIAVQIRHAGRGR